jgi:hypothetical protein
MLMNNRTEKVTNIGVKHPVHLLPHEPDPKCIQRIMLAAPRPEPIGEPQKVLFVYLIQDFHHRVLYDFVLQGCDAQWALSSIRFGDVGSLGRLRAIRSLVYATV